MLKNKKNRLIYLLQDSRNQIIGQIENLDESRWEEVFLGTWTLKDFVAHLIGWDIWGKKANKDILSGNLPKYFVYEDRDWEAMNAQFVKKYSKGSKKSLLHKVKKTHEEVIHDLKELPEEVILKDFNVRRKGYRWTIYDDTWTQIKDEYEYAQQISRWLKTGEIQ
ncbi:MAG: ClbS/DfsB family four-helix bundle protein [Candidatus Levybacteria bacterium]|nr:ClbS/DfsB family four-helix bundle protein [Candidatus Levybacteria bacterium]